MVTAKPAATTTTTTKPFTTTATRTEAGGVIHVLKQFRRKQRTGHISAPAAGSACEGLTRPCGTSERRFASPGGLGDEGSFDFDPG
ncbi:unnamed protein product [Merluccius merluccius]